MTASKSGSEPSDYQIALLLSVMGERALKIYNNFQYSVEEDKNNIAVILLITLMIILCLQKCDVANERHVFFLREQKINENIDNFVIDLEDLASSCELSYHVVTKLPK